MDNSSQFEEVQQKENLENDEKPPDSGGILFNRNFFLSMRLGAAREFFSCFQFVMFICKHIEFQTESMIAFCY